jgi:hypothetical protein
MIERVVEQWHRYLKGELPGGLDELLDDDVVFYSPIVFTPQRGKAVTTLYLQAASVALPGDSPKNSDDADGEREPDDGTGRFRYTKRVVDSSTDTAVLEFETTIDGKYVNGVDIIRCNGAGRIVEFRVMIRPLQAVQAVHRQMGETLEKMQPSE